MSKETGGPAFPVETQLNPISNQACIHQTADYHVYQFPGMTLRDYFAAKYMQGVSAKADSLYDPSSLAKESYEMADLMLKAREAS